MNFRTQLFDNNFGAVQADNLIDAFKRALHGENINKAILIHGSGNNGKTALVNAMMHLNTHHLFENKIGRMSYNTFVTKNVHLEHIPSSWKLVFVEVDSENNPIDSVYFKQLVSSKQVWSKQTNEYIPFSPTIIFISNNSTLEFTEETPATDARIIRFGCLLTYTDNPTVPNSRQRDQDFSQKHVHSDECLQQLVALFE